MPEIPEYVVIDLETENYNSTHHTEECKIVGSNPASPFDPRNKIVLNIWKYNDRPTSTLRKYDDEEVRGYFHGVCVGHNIKFDLLHLVQGALRKGQPRAELLKWLMSVKVWDTMLAEYLLTGQSSTMPSLDQVSEKYGGTLKDDKIKEYWDNGYLTSQIPEEELEEYGIADVENTEKVFLAQYKLAEEMGMLPLIESQMEALVTTTVMEFNGMMFDKEQAVGAIARGNAELDVLIAELNECMGWKEANCMSTKQVGIYFFGGTIEHKVDVPLYNQDGSPVLFKSGMRKGQHKTRKGTEGQLIQPIFQCDPEWKNKTGFKTDNDTLKILSNIADTKGDDATSEFIEKLLYARKLKKDVSTYYTGYSNLTY
jgi:hypothetical protein